LFNKAVDPISEEYVAFLTLILLEEVKVKEKSCGPGYCAVKDSHYGGGAEMVLKKKCPICKGPLGSNP
jgi:hypothetical protein